MTFAVRQLREQFPSLGSGIAHFDSPGGTQTPRPVGEAIAAALCGPLSNRGTSVASERNAEEAVGAFRQAMADLLHADPRGIVYGRSATQLTYDFSRHLAKTWSPGDDIVLSTLDHDANIRPWVQAAERSGVQVRWWEFDPRTAELPVAGLEALLGPRTRLVAVTAASNLLGTITPMADIAALAHAAGALLYVDGVHYTAHAVVDLPRLGADFFVCSPYKFLGPHCAALAADPALLETVQADKLAPSTDVVPERFELGTLPYEIMAGVTAAIDFIAAQGDGGDETDRRSRIVSGSIRLEEHETALRDAVEDRLRAWEPVRVHSNAASRTPTTYFTIDGVSSRDVHRELAQADILVPAGSFYASMAFARLGLEDAEGLRIGMAPYTDTGDVDRLTEALAAIVGRVSPVSSGH